MNLWTGIELNQIFNANVPQDLSITGISIDTRTIKSGDLFVALKGEGRDGHDFLDKAAEAGAVAALVSCVNPNLSLPQILVNDTLNALTLLGEKARTRTKARVIAITGSVGKTSTKEVLAQVLSAFGRVSYAHASYNNHWGVPLSLARMDRHADFAIFEIGMNNPGEIAPLAQLVKPEIAIITTIAPAHIGHMGSLQAIAEEKSDIFLGLLPGGQAIIPHDTSYKDLLIHKAQSHGAGKVTTVGKSMGADYRLLSCQSQPSHQGSFIEIEVREQTYPCSGEHLAHIALTVCAVAEGLNLDLDKVVETLPRVQPIKGRGYHHQIIYKGMDIHLVDDAYNANVTSMLAGLKVLTTLKTQGRRIAVIGEMLELGDFAYDHHREIFQFMVDESIDLVFATGGKAVEMCFQELPIAKQGGYARTAQELIPMVLKELCLHDILYVKGSKGSRVSLVVDALLEQSQPTIIENIA
jgi:UDP-N-acetylmuramoyl-tripeptide--D-alanyl-D-alanine ligase